MGVTNVVSKDQAVTEAPWLPLPLVMAGPVPAIQDLGPAGSAIRTCSTIAKPYRTSVTVSRTIFLIPNRCVLGSVLTAKLLATPVTPITAALPTLP